MKLRHLIVVLAALVLTTACGAQTSPFVEPEEPIAQETTVPGDET